MQLHTHEERFAARVTIGSPEQCWLWQGPTIPHTGYGAFWPYGRAGGKQYAHRYAYERWVGPIPEGMQLDHLCHTADVDCDWRVDCPHRRCVNPAHLEPVTRSTQMRRRFHWLQHEDGSWECARGHLIDEDHGLTKKGACKKCFVVWRREWRRELGQERATEQARARQVERLKMGRAADFLNDHPELGDEVDRLGLRSVKKRTELGWHYTQMGWINPKGLLKDSDLTPVEAAEAARIGLRAYRARVRFGGVFVDGEWVKPDERTRPPVESRLSRREQLMEQRPDLIPEIERIGYRVVKTRLQHDWDFIDGTWRTPAIPVV